MCQWLNLLLGLECRCKKKKSEKSTFKCVVKELQKLGIVLVGKT